MRKRLFARLHAGLHADEVVNTLLKLAVEGHQKVDRVAFGAIDRIEKLAQVRTGFAGGFEVGFEFAPQVAFIAEGKSFGVGLEEKVKGIDHHHVGDQVHLEIELTRGIGEDQARQKIPVRILLPIDEVPGRQDLQGKAGDGCAAVGCRAEPHDLRAQRHGTVISINGLVVQGDADAHRP